MIANIYITKRTLSKKEMRRESFMKKIRAFGFVIFMAVALCACGEKQELIDMSGERKKFSANVIEI